MVSRLEGLSSTGLQHVMAAGEALEAGRVDQATERLAYALSKHPDHPEVLRLRAGILSQRGLHTDALRVMQQALDQRPRDPVYYNTLGTLLGAAGEYESAIVSLQRACELQPAIAFAWYNLGVMLTRCVRNNEAIVALRQAVILEPDQMDARALLADMLRTRGHVEEAATEYREVLSERPTTGMAWWGLADLRTTRFSDDDVRRMQAAQQDPLATDDDLIAIGFALAKALEDGGRNAESLAELASANTIARRRQVWNSHAFFQNIAAVDAAFSPPPSASPKPIGEQVIFITSLPRSGSTLVEQILASHSSVEGAGELPDLPLVLGEESRRRGVPFPHWVRDMRPADWERLGHRYLERTARWRQQRPVFTDKLPNNWIYIGAIRAMLPAAHIIACRRDPLENCFSCYRQHLANNEYKRTFEDLANFWRSFDQHARQAGELYPAQLFEHSYESLLKDPENHIRRLLDFCGLPFELACVNFHESQREVRSPSATQVRQPLHDTSRASRYGALLDPLRAALNLPQWQA